MNDESLVNTVLFEACFRNLGNLIKDLNFKFQINY